MVNSYPIPLNADFGVRVYRCIYLHLSNFPIVTTTKESTVAFSSAIDIDECEIYPDICPKMSECQNQYGNYSCVCGHGYEQDLDGHDCKGNENFRIQLSSTEVKFTSTLIAMIPFELLLKKG